MNNPTKYLTALFVIAALLMLANSPKSVQPAFAQEKSDSLRDLVILIHDKQPDTQVTLTFITKGYSPYGPIAHIGDDYVCIFQEGASQREVCSPFEKLQSVEVYPGIHR